jgi:hypothetical protein
MTGIQPVRCRVCRSTDVDAHSSFCYGCKEIICHRCCTTYGHQGDGPHALTKAALRKWKQAEAKRLKKATAMAVDVETLIRMSVATQERMKQQGIALHFTLSWAPLSPKTSVGGSM